MGDSMCIHCLKNMNLKYNTKNLKKKCEHYKLYHYHCYIKLCENTLNEKGEMCCFHCLKFENKFETIEFKDKNYKNKVTKKIQNHLNEMNTKNLKKIERLIILSKILNILEENLNLYLKHKKFMNVLVIKLNEFIIDLKKIKTINIAPHIINKAEYLLTQIK
jgi:hypothetical protein